MAEYDPSAPADFVDDGYEEGDEYQYDQPDAEQEEEEDDDYDPSSFNFGDGDEEDMHVTKDSEQPLNTETPAPKPQRTVGGFIVDDEDDEEEQEDAVPPPPSQLNGDESVQSAYGDVAMAEAAPVAPATETTPIASEPLQEDTSSAAAQSVPVHGSSSLVLPHAPVSNSPAQASAPALSVSAPSLQSPTTDQGKQQALTANTTSALQSATATPQPPTVAAAPPPQTNGSVPPTPTTQRLPHDKVGQLEDRIKEDPKADTEAWRTLIQHYREKGQLDNARKVYSRFFDVFPSAVCILVYLTFRYITLVQETALFFAPATRSTHQKCALTRSTTGLHVGRIRPNGARAK